MLSKTEESTKITNESKMINGNNWKDTRSKFAVIFCWNKGYTMNQYFTTSFAAQIIGSDIYDNNLHDKRYKLFSHVSGDTRTENLSLSVDVYLSPKILCPDYDDMKPRSNLRF